MLCKGVILTKNKTKNKPELKTQLLTEDRATTINAQDYYTNIETKVQLPYNVLSFSDSCKTNISLVLCQMLITLLTLYNSNTWQLSLLSADHPFAQFTVNFHTQVQQPQCQLIPNTHEKGIHSHILIISYSMRYY